MSKFNLRIFYCGFLIMMFMKATQTMDVKGPTNFNSLYRINCSFLKAFFKKTLCFYDNKVWFYDYAEESHHYGYSIQAIYDFIEIAFDDSIEIDHGEPVTLIQNLKEQFIEFLEIEQLEDGEDIQQYFVALYKSDQHLNPHIFETALHINNNCFKLKEAFINKDYETFKNCYYEPFSIRTYIKEGTELYSQKKRQKKQKKRVRSPHILRNICNFGRRRVHS